MPRKPVLPDDLSAIAQRDLEGRSEDLKTRVKRIDAGLKKAAKLRRQKRSIK